jgi:hypothetical protein
MLFSTVLVSAIVAAPAASQGTYFTVGGLLKRDINSRGSLVTGDCGLTKFQKIGKGQPAVPTIKVSKKENFKISWM